MFLRYIHLFRAIAIIFIVAGHTDTFLSLEADTVAQRFVQAVFRNGSVMFVFIAGFLFQYLSPRFETKKYYLSKLKFVVLPYFLISLPAIAYVLLVPFDRGGYPGGFYDWPIAGQVAFLYATGSHMMQLWFIPMIVMFYALAPLLIRLDRDGRIYWAVPVLFAVSLFMHRPLHNIDPIHAFFVFLPIYFIGMWSARNIDRVMTFVARWHWPLFAALIAMVLVQVFVLRVPGNVYSEKMFAPHPDVLDVITLQKVLLCFLAMYWLKLVQGGAPKFLDAVADTSFAIFFLHGYVIMFSYAVENKMAVDLGASFSIPLYLTYTAFVLAAVSVGIFAVKRTMGRNSRLLIGA